MFTMANAMIYSHYILQKGNKKQSLELLRDCSTLLVTGPFGLDMVVKFLDGSVPLTSTDHT